MKSTTKELKAIVADRTRKIAELSIGVGICNNAAAIRCHEMAIAEIREELAARGE